MRKFLLRSLLFVTIFILIGYLTYPVIRNILVKNCHNKMFWMYGKENKIYDYAVIGSSRVFSMADINIMDSVSRRNGINLAHDGSGYTDNYLTLFLFYSNKNTINKLYIQVDPFSLNSDSSFSYPFHDYLFLNFMNKTEIDAVIKENTNWYKYYLWKYVPFIRVIEFSNYYNLKFFVGSFFKTNKWDNSKGSMILSNVDLKFNNKNKRLNYTLQKNDSIALERIVSLAKNNNTQIFFYTAPIYYPFIEKMNYFKSEVYLNKLSKKNNILWIDYRKDAICKDSIYFKDCTHLNNFGVKKFSILLGEDIAKN